MSQSEHRIRVKKVPKELMSVLKGRGRPDTGFTLTEEEQREPKESDVPSSP